MLIGTDHPATIPLYIRRQLYSLTFRYKSPMKVAITNILAGRWKGRIVYALDESRATVLSWGLLVWRPGEESLGPAIMLYTRRGERGKGLAKDVFWGLRWTVTDGDYQYYPHTPKVHDFYMRRYAERVEGKVPPSKVVWVRQ